MADIPEQVRRHQIGEGQAVPAATAMALIQHWGKELQQYSYPGDGRLGALFSLVGHFVGSLLDHPAVGIHFSERVSTILDALSREHLSKLETDVREGVRRFAETLVSIYDETPAVIERAWDGPSNYWTQNKWPESMSDAQGWEESVSMPNLRFDPTATLILGPCIRSLWYGRKGADPWIWAEPIVDLSSRSSAPDTWGSPEQFLKLALIGLNKVFDAVGHALGEQPSTQRSELDTKTRNLVAAIAQAKRLQNVLRKTGIDAERSGCEAALSLALVYLDNVPDARPIGKLLNGSGTLRVLKDLGEPSTREEYGFTPEDVDQICEYLTRRLQESAAFILHMVPEWRAASDVGSVAARNEDGPDGRERGRGSGTREEGGDAGDAHEDGPVVTPLFYWGGVSHHIGGILWDIINCLWLNSESVAEGILCDAVWGDSTVPSNRVATAVCRLNGKLMENGIPLRVRRQDGRVILEEVS